MEKIKIEDSKLASYIRDELTNRGYRIAAFDVNKRRLLWLQEHYELIKFSFDIDKSTYIDVAIDELSSISVGDQYNEWEYSYSLNRVLKSFPDMSKLRPGDKLEIVNDPLDIKTPLKILFTRRGDHSDSIDCEVDREMVTNFIDKILIELGLKDFVE